MRIKHLNHMQRYRQVLNILGRHGFGFVFDRLPVRNRKSKETRKDTYLTGPERLRSVLEQLGPTYVKLGQLLSTRPDLIPAEYIRELEKLQDSVPPFPFKQVQQVLDEEGLRTEDVFASFSEEPLASASIGQVHEAILKTGEKVVVKVQRPGIGKIIENDLEILYELVGMLEKHTKWGRLYQLTDILDEFANALRKEIDFAQEGRNADKFRENFRQNANVLIPKVYWEYTSRRVLVLEYIGGVKVSEFEQLIRAGFDLKRVANHIVEALFQQIYEHGFFHADPHPGNIAIAPGEKVIFYDFGQVGTVDEVLIERCMDLVMAMVRYDVNGVTRALLQVGIATRHVNREELRRDVSRLQQKYYGMPFSQIHVGEALGELVQLSFKYQVRVPPELSLMVKMMMTIEGLLSRLDPGLSVVEIAEPYGKAILKKRFSLDRIRQEASEVLLDHYMAARNLPREIESIMNMLEEGELKLKLEHTNLNRVQTVLDIISNRISLSIIIASIIVGSSLIVAGNREGFIPGVPLVEIGFATAVVLGLFLAYSILKSGRY
ncbi:ABC1 kinase family protein [Syntrophothermus lipocalidus]|uniref:ABC-1 domain protein n=1 Tax=Syntrophothermus lipocalidus (strain DSM 12680 / TGB-C1) TaxID=643648 RepID=D7CN77_SYNLT|nr:AarF/ABC1/UbiB kinase family protein [Syntrophothermus lipocalidus]ADI02162.1 ABC-1 domain protein [Syntrophothermus lipocalidus DSM 12680]